jgi:hypothetical protein
LNARSERNGTLVASFSLKLTAKAHSQMLRMAARQRVSGADVLRAALDEYLANHYATPEIRRKTAAE